MRAPRSTALLILPLMLAASGCVVARTNAEGDDSRLSTLTDEVKQVKREVAEMKGAQAPSIDVGKKLADMDERVRAFDNDIQALKGKVEELERARSAKESAKDPGKDKTSAELAALSTRTDSLVQRMNALAKSLDSLTNEVKSSPGQTRTGGAIQPPVQQKNPKELYDEAYALYREGKFSEAQAKFRDYVDLYPETSLTDNAIFWIGESYYDQGDYEQAILQYDKVVQKYPTGDKVASSLLKQAFAFAAMGDNLDARILLKKVIAEHPGSEQASIAKKKLEVLGN